MDTPSKFYVVEPSKSGWVTVGPEFDTADEARAYMRLTHNESMMVSTREPRYIGAGFWTLNEEDFVPPVSI